MRSCKQGDLTSCLNHINIWTPKGGTHAHKRKKLVFKLSVEGVQGGKFLKGFELEIFLSMKWIEVEDGIWKDLFCWN